MKRKMNKSLVGEKVIHTEMVAHTQALGKHVKNADGTVEYKTIPRQAKETVHTITADTGRKVRLDNGWELPKSHLDGKRRWHTVGETHYDKGAYRLAAQECG
jgi:hypothetical protein